MEQRLNRKVGWTSKEEDKLRDYVNKHGAHHWDTIARKLDIGKSGNSCRLKWANHLKPNIVREKFSDEEMLKILQLRYERKGWSKIAKELPGRTDNQIKNFWNSRRLKKEAEELNCEVNSEDFLKKMTARLSERIQAATSTAHHAYNSMVVAGGGSVTADTLVTSSHAVESCSAHGSTSNADQDCLDESYWANLISFCESDDNFPMPL